MTSIEEDFVRRREHDECQRTVELYYKRLKDEDDRQNHRIQVLEDTVKQISSLSISVEKLAINMENMLKVQMSQGSRLEKLENRDGEMWRKVIGYIATAIVGIVIGFVFKQAGMS